MNDVEDVFVPPPGAEVLEGAEGLESVEDKLDDVWEQASEIKGETLAEFEDSCDKLFELKDERDKLEKAAKEVGKKMDALKVGVLATLQAHQKTTHKGRRGTVYIQHKSYPKMPKDPIKRVAFFNYLKKKGDFDTLITVNHQSLGSYYKGEEEAAKDKNGVVDPLFHIPGLDIFEETSVRTRKG